MVVGFVLAGAGLGLFTLVGVHSSYFPHIFPAEIIVSFGMGTAFVPLSSTALIGVDPADAGVASAMVNTTQQTGGSLGVSLLNTIAASSTAGYIAAHGSGAAVRAAAAVHGYTTAFSVSAILLGVAAVTTFFILRATRHDVGAGGLEPTGPVGLDGLTPLSSRPDSGGFRPALRGAGPGDKSRRAGFLERAGF